MADQTTAAGTRFPALLSRACTIAAPGVPVRSCAAQGGRRVTYTAEPTTAPPLCIGCGRYVEPDAAFCGQCGRPYAPYTPVQLTSPAPEAPATEPAPTGTMAPTAALPPAPGTVGELV